MMLSPKVRKEALDFAMRYRQQLEQPAGDERWGTNVCDEFCRGFRLGGVTASLIDLRGRLGDTWSPLPVTEPHTVVLVGQRSNVGRILNGSMIDFHRRQIDPGADVPTFYEPFSDAHRHWTTYQDYQQRRCLLLPQLDS